MSQAQVDYGGASAREAASELLGRYRDAVYLWCFRRVRDHDWALDLAQDVLVSAYRGLPQFAGRSKFSSWVFAIARNRCLSALRPKSLARDDEVDPADLLDPREGPEAQLDRIQDEGFLLEWIRATLEPSEQRAVWMRYVDGLAVDEITRLLGLTGSTGARSVLQNARRKLRAAAARGADAPGGKS